MIPVNCGNSNMHGIGERYNLGSHIWKKSLWKVLFEGIESQEIIVYVDIKQITKEEHMI
jgi:hypothetical protein